MKNAMITGASGTIGQLVLAHCLASDEIEQVSVIVRKPLGIQHPKLKEVVHHDFLHFEAVQDVFAHQHIVYYCLGVYTGTVNDALFKQITVDYTIAFTEALCQYSPQVNFCFLSGNGADLSEKSKLSFARYKGMAENYLINKNFHQFYSFRPAYIYPVSKRYEPNAMYRMMRVLYPMIKLLGKNYSIKSTELATAIFKTGLYGYEKSILENKDILNCLSFHLQTHFEQLV